MTDINLTIEQAAEELNHRNHANHSDWSVYTYDGLKRVHSGPGAPIDYSEADALIIAAWYQQRAVSSWRKFPDHLPPRHQNVWCLNRDGHQFEGCICYGMHAPFFTYPRGDGSASNTAPAWIDVIYWMPLPTPPEFVEELKP